MGPGSLFLVREKLILGLYEMGRDDEGSKVNEEEGKRGVYGSIREKHTNEYN